MEVSKVHAQHEMLAACGRGFSWGSKQANYVKYKRCKRLCTC